MSYQALRFINNKRHPLFFILISITLLFSWICMFNSCAFILYGGQDYYIKTTDEVSGNIIIAESGFPEDIQNAVNKASVGDTVIIPAGYFLFNGTVTVPAGIILHGKGRDVTILKKSGTSTMFVFDGSNEQQVELSNITLIGREGEIDWDEGLYLKNDCKNFRIFDCEFKGFGHAGIVVRGNAKGVIDQNSFIDCYYPGLGYGIEVIGDGDASWSRPLELGTENAVFIEDNVFSGCRHSVASSYGSRYVFRYNTVYTNHYGHQVDAHGAGTWERGSRSYEIYENTLIGGDTRGPYDHNTAIGIRGGDGVIFNNTITQSTDRPMILVNDGGDDGPYPELDQIRDLFMWNNLSNGIEINQADCINSPYVAYILARLLDDPIILLEGRDYYFYKKNAYAPYTYPHPLTLDIPILSISASCSPTSGVAPLIVNFTAIANGGVSPYTYSWDFGDGSTSSLQNPSHSYSQPDTYTATLNVTDSSQNHTSDSLVITVSMPTVNLDISALTASLLAGQGGTTNPLPGSHFYSFGSFVQVEALAYDGYRFSKWSGDVSASDVYDKGIIIDMDKNRSISANFFTKCGDVTGDSIISPGDAQAAFDIYLGINSNPTESERENADVNCDGTQTQPLVTPADAQAIFYKYMGNEEFPCDCSCNSRTTTLSIKSIQTQNASISINSIQETEYQEIIVPIVIENPYDTKAFGFDLIFSSDSLEYVGVMRSEPLYESFNIVANEIADGVLRTGGYRIKSNVNRYQYSQISIKLIFRKNGEEKKQPSFMIVNTVDDIKNAYLINKTTTQRNFKKY